MNSGQTAASHKYPEPGQTSPLNPTPEIPGTDAPRSIQVPEWMMIFLRDIDEEKLVKLSQEIPSDPIVSFYQLFDFNQYRVPAFTIVVRILISALAVGDGAVISLCHIQNRLIAVRNQLICDAQVVFGRIINV
jgi:hypothetical protein